MEIHSIKYHRHPITSTNADCEDFTIHMGYCSSDILSLDSFEGNYTPGTKELVFSTALLTVDMSVEWAEIVLDTPFFYDGSDNLIIEIQWDNETEDNSYYNYEWNSGTDRCIFQQGSAGIETYTSLPQMILLGTEALENETFAGVKVRLGT